MFLWWCSSNVLRGVCVLLTRGFLQSVMKIPFMQEVSKYHVLEIPLHLSFREVIVCLKHVQASRKSGVNSLLS